STVALVAESTMTTPKPVNSTAVEAMRWNSRGSGARMRPREMRAARPDAGSACAGGRSSCVIGALPADPFLHRFGEATATVLVTGELIEGGCGRGQQHRAATP